MMVGWRASMPVIIKGNGMMIEAFRFQDVRRPERPSKTVTFTISAFQSCRALRPPFSASSSPLRRWRSGSPARESCGWAMTRPQHCSLLPPVCGCSRSTSDRPARCRLKSAARRSARCDSRKLGVEPRTEQENHGGGEQPELQEHDRSYRAIHTTQTVESGKVEAEQARDREP